MTPRSQLAAHVIQICMAPSAAQQPCQRWQTRVWHSCGLWWQHEPWTSTRTQAAVGPQTQTWHLTQHGLCLGCLHGPSWHCRSPRLAWPQWQYDTQVPACSQMAAPTLGIHLAFNNSSSHRYQCRPYGRATHPDMALDHSLGPDVTKASGGSTRHPDLHDSDDHIRYQHGLMSWPRLWASA